MTTPALVAVAWQYASGSRRLAIWPARTCRPTSSPGIENHARATQEMSLAQLAEGHIDRRTSKQLFDSNKGRFLPDRFVEGTCPYCDHPDARGDQCDNCGLTLDPTDLINPRSKLSGATPVLRETEHYYYRYSDFADRLKAYLESRKGWRTHVLNFSLGWLAEGLLDRAITSDIEWGLELPVDDLGPGKRIYVWYDAVIGYLSASQEWAESTSDPERWKHWWQNVEAGQVRLRPGPDRAPHRAERRQRGAGHAGPLPAVLGRRARRDPRPDRRVTPSRSGGRAPIDKPTPLFQKIDVEADAD